MKQAPDPAIDFRSDTVTQPGAEMKAAMVAAPLGDDVYEEDPTVQALEARMASELGKPAALFFPSGSMANLTAIMTQAAPGKVIYAGRNSHVKLYELGSYARIAGLSLFEIEDRGGRLDQAYLEKDWQAAIYYMPEPGIVTVENTHNMLGGLIYPEPDLARLASFVHGKNVPLHMDGARIFHAAAAAGQKPAYWTRHVDTVMTCISKGLGAPVGSILAGSQDTISRARRVRKLLGGGMRQAGMLAAAGLYALDHHLALLPRDNDRCAKFYAAIKDVPWLEAVAPHTNILIFRLQKPCAAKYVQAMNAKGLKISAIDDQTVRAVFHLNLSDEACDALAEQTRNWSVTA